MNSCVATAIALSGSAPRSRLPPHSEREKLRALKAPEIAVAAIEAAEVPITYAQMQPLVRMLDQVASCVHAMCACELCVCGLRRRKGPPLEGSRYR